MRRNVRGHARQRGMSVWQTLIVLLVIGVGLSIVVAIGPLYITNFSVQSTIKSLQNEPELASKSILEMRQAIERKFDVNQIDVVQAVCRDKEKSCLKIEKTKTSVRIDGNYACALATATTQPVARRQCVERWRWCEEMQRNNQLARTKRRGG